jgi:hypothetical protein
VEKGQIYKDMRRASCYFQSLPKYLFKRVLGKLHFLIKAVTKKICQTPSKEIFEKKHKSSMAYS